MIKVTKKMIVQSAIFLIIVLLATICASTQAQQTQTPLPKDAVCGILFEKKSYTSCDLNPWQGVGYKQSGTGTYCIDGEAAKQVTDEKKATIECKKQSELKKTIEGICENICSSRKSTTKNPQNYVNCKTAFQSGWRYIEYRCK